VGLFNAYATFLADVNLLLQGAILLILIVSLRFKFRHNYMKHGIIMGLAVALHTISIFVVMAPSLMASTGLFANLLDRLALVILPHAVLGSLVEILGVYLLSIWILNRRDPKACFKNRTTMRATIALWVVELILGIYLYVLLYPSG
jgi:uncharacterized membrane protein YozB (DUF420 family)